MLKSLIPDFIKYFLWFVLKSPQRKIGWFTVKLEVYAYLKVFYASIFGFKPLKKISICVGIYNRSEIFLKYFVSSLSLCKNQDLIELSVFDMGSDDIKSLKKEIELIYKGKLVYTLEKKRFSRAYAFNKAVKQSTNAKIFICDADFSLPENIVEMCNKFTYGDVIWFPIVFYLYKNKPAVFDKKNGEWMIWGGKGLIACEKASFEKVGMLDEKFTSWGYEDEELWERFYKNKYLIIRTKAKDLLHHWHESYNPKYKKLAELADSGLL